MDTNTIKIMNQDFIRLNRFDGASFMRWRDKLKFMLIALKVYYVLDPNCLLFPNQRKMTMK